MQAEALVLQNLDFCDVWKLGRFRVRRTTHNGGRGDEGQGHGLLENENVDQVANDGIHRKGVCLSGQTSMGRGHDGQNATASPRYLCSF